jgi:hypothetical protein
MLVFFLWAYWLDGGGNDWLKLGFVGSGLHRYYRGRVDLLLSALPKTLMLQSPRGAYSFLQEVSYGKKRFRLPLVRL